MAEPTARVDALATACIESTNGQVTGWHKLAGSAAMTAACDAHDKRTRDIYRFEEAKALLQAVFVHDSSLSTADMLRVAACIASRAAGEFLEG
jgi:hypothetical protein